MYNPIYIYTTFIYYILDGQYIITSIIKDISDAANNLDARVYTCYSSKNKGSCRECFLCKLGASDSAKGKKNPSGFISLVTTSYQITLLTGLLPRVGTVEGIYKSSRV